MNSQLIIITLYFFVSLLVNPTLINKVRKDVPEIEQRLACAIFSIVWPLALISIWIQNKFD